MPIPTKPGRTIQILEAGDAFALFEPEADIAAAAAKKQLKTVPMFAGDYWWPLWQLSWYFSAGTAKTATVIPHVRDAETGHWHALSEISLMHEDAVTSSTSQVMQFEAPPNHDAVAMEVTLTNADERPHITLRGAAWVTVPA